MDGYYYIFYAYQVAMLFAAIASLRAFRLAWPKPYRHFSIFLWVTLFIEIFATFIWDWLHKPLGYNAYNLWIYNIYLIPQYLFYLYFFYQILHFRIVRVLILVVAVLYPIWALLNILYFQGLFTITDLTIFPAYFITALLAGIYFYQLLTDKIIYRLKILPPFWIASGSFLFHTSTIVVFIYLRYFIDQNDPNAFLRAYGLNVFVNTLMYSLYAIAYLCRKQFTI